MILLDEKHEADFKAKLELPGFELRIPWPYLDNARPKANVTVGVGCMIPSLSAFEALRWSGGIDATPLIPSAWAALQRATPGLMAAAYRSLTSLRLPDAEIDRLRDARIAALEGNLIRLIAKIAAFPVTARQAILDMGWNLGAQRLRDEYFGPRSKFGPACYAGEWEIAAEESARLGIAKVRNEYTAGLIRAAASPDAEKAGTSA